MMTQFVHENIQKHKCTSLRLGELEHHSIPYLHRRHRAFELRQRRRRETQTTEGMQVIRPGRKKDRSGPVAKTKHMLTPKSLDLAYQ